MTCLITCDYITSPVHFLPEAVKHQTGLVNTDTVNNRFCTDKEEKQTICSQAPWWPSRLALCGEYLWSGI